MRALEQSLLKDAPQTAGRAALTSASITAGGGAGRGAASRVQPKDDRLSLIRQVEKITLCRNKVGG